MKGNSGFLLAAIADSKCGEASPFLLWSISRTASRSPRVEPS
jgi:hypothetical protein